MLCLACGACDRAFGLDTVHDLKPLDAAQLPDGPITGQAVISDLRIGGPLLVGESTTVDALISGTAGLVVSYAFSVTGPLAENGSFAQPTGDVVVGAGSRASTTFTAPTNPATVMIDVAISGTMIGRPVGIYQGVTYGMDMSTSGSQTINANQLWGTEIHVVTAGQLKSVGIWMTSGATPQMRFALYSDSSNAPGTKLVELAPVVLQPTRNILSLIPTPNAPIELTMSTNYWLMSLADTSFNLPALFVGGNADRAWSGGSRPFATGMPDVLTGSVQTGVDYPYFIVVAQ